LEDEEEDVDIEEWPEDKEEEVDEEELEEEEGDSKSLSGCDWSGMVLECKRLQKTSPYQSSL
jgi:hypothetical protein